MLSDVSGTTEQAGGKEEMSYRVGIDVGGTFTDLVLIDEETGRIYTSKSSSTPGAPIGGVMAVIDKLEQPKAGIEVLVHGTTVGTNALLERKGAATALITTRGFRDVIFIQRMNRKHHYDLKWDKPVPLTERQFCFEVGERINYKGEVVQGLDEDEARRVIGEIKALGPEAIAVALLFAYANPVHELRLRELIQEVYPEAAVSLSHEVYPRWREYDRMSTTIADAYLKPLVSRYMSNVAGGLRAHGVNASFLIMKSNGGVEDHESAAHKPVDLLMSGPVGGVLSAIHLGRLTNRANLVAVDMGGTSFDVSLIANGVANRTTEFELEWGLPICAPMIDVRSIGAGGGSLAWIDKGGLLRVGPQSAGARPGPACYGRGGAEATVTDANLVLGRLNPNYFLGGEMSLDVEAARTAVAAVAQRVGMDTVETAQVIVDLVNHNMVNAIRLVSIDRGLDPRDFTLVSFGGAGSLHAMSLAEIIGMREVLVPIHQGVFSALGLTIADMRVDESQTAAMRSDLLRADHVNEVLERLTGRAAAKLASEGYRGSP
ncbi:MAG: hydantoinase/oxoprolinase family protein, partial [Planctomycetes bacterium]|nr:hydantoinase/oxoprolinase family protein [Planctomycetota bacterium]